MQTKITKTFIPISIVFGGLLLAGGVTFGLYSLDKDLQVEEVKGITTENEDFAVSEVSEVPTPAPSSFSFPTPANTWQIHAVEGQNSTPQPTTLANESAPPPQSSQPSPTPNPSPSTVTQKISVSVSINDAGSFSLSIDQGKNHCEVLSQALDEGKISSLNMQYNSAFNSHAVYQINGLGQNEQVWWGYKVNGNSPPLGCSHVQVNDGDQVLWTYVGPN